MTFFLPLLEVCFNQIMSTRSVFDTELDRVLGLALPAIDCCIDMNTAGLSSLTEEVRGSRRLVDRLEAGLREKVGEFERKVAGREQSLNTKARLRRC